LTNGVIYLGDVSLWIHKWTDWGMLRTVRAQVYVRCEFVIPPLDSSIVTMLLYFGRWENGAKMRWCPHMASRRKRTNIGKPENTF